MKKERDTLNQQLDDLKKSAGSVDDFKKTIEDLQGINKTLKEQHETEAHKFSFGVSGIFCFWGAKHPSFL